MGRLVVLNRWNGRPTQVFVEMPTGGVLLVWEFSGYGAPREATLYARLTDDEAQAVFDADPLTGLLESVRKTMANRIALISVHDSDNEDMDASVVPFAIPSDGNESEFLAALDSAALDAPEFFDREVARYRREEAKLIAERNALRAHLRDRRKKLAAAKIALALLRVGVRPAILQTVRLLPKLPKARAV